MADQTFRRPWATVLGASYGPRGASVRWCELEGKNGWGRAERCEWGRWDGEWADHVEVFGLLIIGLIPLSGNVEIPDKNGIVCVEHGL
jgi:hypothetical protein